ncbi:rRNA-binding ribosome biosynthesis protein rpf2 [Ataeniobius toweri]|uniref:rRNA-binding ribosome biosynthesis protein rpf2 n=1 Tax=Ataeniobius toweri TaxID=208326 RepID=A0ABU7B1P2_9TELE|nr:rRNA-binding ribosome biosynthesis protein rpf2 [Ataeniobius toweri]
MTQLDGIVKPKTKRSKRFLESRAPKLIEDVRSTMIMKGGNTSQTITTALKDIYSLKKPNAVLYKKSVSVVGKKNSDVTQRDHQMYQGLLSCLFG